MVKGLRDPPSWYNVKAVGVTIQDKLPVQDVLEPLLGHLDRGPCVVLVAPPGAGKTTLVPIAIQESGLLGDQKVLMLQPRRVAARLSAKRIAELTGSPLGELVGYRVRHDTKVSVKTKIEVVTEGLLTRMLQRDPFLEGVGCVILDEFHERSVHADLCLALLNDLRRDARPDLKVVVMSATLDAKRVSTFLDDAPIVESKGRLYPVEVHYERRVDARPLPRRCADAVRRALEQNREGNVLVFLPGAREIDRTRAALGDLGAVRVVPLHGRLSHKQQDLALRPGRGRTVILSTNVAETSLTIPGVRVVVDSGLVRQLRFDARLGMDRLLLGPISRASAEQRAGRSGRLCPGVCYRLWTESDHNARPDFAKPEIARVDPASVLLEILAWGAQWDGFGWFERPPKPHVERALKSLDGLGALRDNRITDRGRTLVRLPLRPDLAALVIRSEELGVLALGAAIATLLSSQNPITKADERGSLSASLDLWMSLDRGEAWAQKQVNRQAWSTLKKSQRQIVRVMRGDLSEVDAKDLDRLDELLISVFKDRVGRQRERGATRYQLAGGAGAVLVDREDPRPAPWIVALGLQALDPKKQSDLIIRLWHPINHIDLPVERTTTIRFDERQERVMQRELERFRGLTVREMQSTSAIDPIACQDLLAKAAAQNPERAFDLDRDERALVDRFAFLQSVFPDREIPDLSFLVRAAAEDLEVPPLLHALCFGARSFSDLRKQSCVGAIRSFVGEQSWRFMERCAPSHIDLPGGTRARVHYDDVQQPRVEARVQQLFGLRKTPEIAQGRARLMVHVLAPNQRPVQITQDLENFWDSSYLSVRKDLRGRYPKHAWPEKPTVADAKRRRTKRSK